MNTIAEWLASLGMAEYTLSFTDNGIDISTLPLLTDQDLKDIGVLLGHRRKMLAAIADLTGNVTHANCPTAASVAQPKQPDSVERQQAERVVLPDSDGPPVRPDNLVSPPSDHWLDELLGDPYAQKLVGKRFDAFAAKWRVCFSYLEKGEALRWYSAPFSRRGLFTNFKWKHFTALIWPSILCPYWHVYRRTYLFASALTIFPIIIEPFVTSHMYFLLGLAIANTSVWCSPAIYLCHIRKKVLYASNILDEAAADKYIVRNAGASWTSVAVYVGLLLAGLLLLSAADFVIENGQSLVSVDLGTVHEASQKIPGIGDESGSGKHELETAKNNILASPSPARKCQGLDGRPLPCPGIKPSQPSPDPNNVQNSPQPPTVREGPKPTICTWRCNGDGTI